MEKFRVLQNRSGQVRTTLHIEDVLIPKFETMLEFELVSIMAFQDEDFLILKDAIPVPKFNKFYASRIKSSKDPYLYEVIQLLLYLNPVPNYVLRKKLVEFIILRFSKMEMKPSQVKMDELIATPVLSFEEVQQVLNLCLIVEKKDPVIPTGVYVLFSQNSRYTKEVKISIHADIRELKIRNHLSSAIHIVAEHLMDTYDKVKITTSKIENTKMVTTKKGPASIRSISKYMSPATRTAIEDHNIGASFKSYITFEKYERFLELDANNDSLERTASVLETSKSTVLDFRKIKDASN